MRGETGGSLLSRPAAGTRNITTSVFHFQSLPVQVASGLHYPHSLTRRSDTWESERGESSSRAPTVISGFTFHS